MQAEPSEKVWKCVVQRIARWWLLEATVYEFLDYSEMLFSNYFGAFRWIQSFLHQVCKQFRFGESMLMSQTSRTKYHVVDRGGSVGGEEEAVARVFGQGRTSERSGDEEIVDFCVAGQGDPHAIRGVARVAVAVGLHIEQSHLTADRARAAHPQFEAVANVSVEVRVLCGGGADVPAEVAGAAVACGSRTSYVSGSIRR